MRDVADNSERLLIRQTFLAYEEPSDLRALDYTVDPFSSPSFRSIGFRKFYRVLTWEGIQVFGALATI
jgi:hypothetical protein